VNLITRISVTASTLALSACGYNSTSIAIDQDHLCEVSDYDVETVAAACQPSQKVVFLPDIWGNVQMPVIFAALHCDHRFNIVSNEGGVSCIYKPLKQGSAE